MCWTGISIPMPSGAIWDGIRWTMPERDAVFVDEEANKERFTAYDYHIAPPRASRRIILQGALVMLMLWRSQPLLHPFFRRLNGKHVVLDRIY